MRASVKLRPQASDNPSAPPFLPLLRLKLPVTILGVPFLSSASLGPSPSDPSLGLRTLLPRGPSLHITYHPASPLRDLSSDNFSLTVRCGLGPLASPVLSPLSLSAHLPLLPGSRPSLSLRLSAHLGDFSFKRALPISTSNPIPVPKENGGGIHRPLPIGRRDPPWPPAGLNWTLLDSGVLVSTAVPILDCSEVKVRWGVRLPPHVEAGMNVAPPFLIVDKVSLQRSAGRQMGRKLLVDGIGGRSKKMVDANSGSELEGTWSWIGQEADDLRMEQISIRRGIEDIRARILFDTGRKW